MNEDAIRELIKLAEAVTQKLRELLEDARKEREAREGMDMHGDIV